MGERQGKTTNTEAVAWVRLGWVGLSLLTKEHLAVVSGLAGALELVVVHLGVRGAEVGPKPLGWLLCHFHSDLKIHASSVIVDRSHPLFSKKSRLELPARASARYRVASILSTGYGMLGFCIALGFGAPYV